MEFNSVVFPAPKNPVRTVTGILAFSCTPYCAKKNAARQIFCAVSVHCEVRQSGSVGTPRPYLRTEAILCQRTGCDSLINFFLQVGATWRKQVQVGASELDRVRVERGFHIFQAGVGGIRSEFNTESHRTRGEHGVDRPTGRQAKLDEPSHRKPV